MFTPIPVLYKLYVSFLHPLFPPSTRSPDLDRANVNNAYVSGMKQDLNMQGNDFNVGPISSPHNLTHPAPDNQYHVYLRLYHRNDTKYFISIASLILLDISHRQLDAATRPP
ncbi:hypothetical protein J3R82DRAFT_4465 [Butyriboletus roseoflavus]|nr:hypothetical protein J3R82DRAFT_4465 [Butyriboletus roseoflavus]